MRQTSAEQQHYDSEWLTLFVIFLDENCDKKKFERIKKIFVETYYVNIGRGLNLNESMENAKITALCFLIQRQ